MAPEFPTPRPSPIDWVSPSLANQLLACELRAAFERDDDTASWRRPSTFTALGNVAHEVTEAAYKRSAWPDEPDELRAGLEALWDAKVRDSAAELVERWPSTEPPPPEEWPGYQLTRARTIRKAQRLIETYGRIEAKDMLLDAASTTPSGLERTLSDEESRLWGRSDRIETHGDTTRVVDLKTGLHQDEPSDDQRRQLLLYAVLVQRDTGTWPAEIAIEDASGNLRKQALDPVEAEAALAEVSAAVRRFNEHTANSDLLAHASPDRDRCRWCPFRVVCGAYWSTLSSEWGHYSIKGEIVTSGTSDDGAYAQLRLTSPIERSGDEVHISGLPEPPTSESTMLAVTDFIGHPDGDTFRARWSTLVRAY